MKDINKLLEQYGWKDKRELLETLRATADWASKCEFYLQSPKDYSKKLKLEKYQYKVIRDIQYGENDIVLLSPRQLGKSTVCAAAAFAILTEGPYKVGLFSPSQDQSNLLMRKIKYFMRTSPFSHMIKKPDTQAKFHMTNGAECYSFPASEATIRGYTFDYVFIDEASRLPDHIMVDAIYPMTYATDGKKILLSTPFGQRGEFWKAYTLAKEGDSYTLYRVNPLEVSWVDKKKLAKKIREMGGYDSLAVRQELFAEFIAAGNIIFTPDMIEASYDRTDKLLNWWKNYDEKPKPNKNCFYVISSDFGKLTNQSSICVAHKSLGVAQGDYGRKGQFILDYMESWSKMPYPFIRKRIIKISRYFRPKLFIPDGRSMGTAIIDDLKEDFRDNKIYLKIYKTGKKVQREGFVANQYNKQDMVETLERSYLNDNVLIPMHGNPGPALANKMITIGEPAKGALRWEIYQLEQELLSFSYEVVSSRTIRFGKEVSASGVQDDRVIAWAQAVYALDKKRQGAVMPSGGKSNESKTEGEWELKKYYDKPKDYLWKKDKKVRNRGGHLSCPM